MLPKYYMLPIMLFIIIGCEQVGGEKGDYNVYYYPKEGGAIYLGKVTGLNKCRQVVVAHTKVNKLLRAPDDYICCKIDEDSDCSERLK